MEAFEKYLNRRLRPPNLSDFVTASKGRQPAGKFVEVDPDTVFRTGDHIRLTVEANDVGYLYIVQRGSSGIWSVLFPRDQIDSRGNRVGKNQRQEIPRDLYFNITDPPGDEKLFVVLSRQPEADWDNLIRSVRGEQRPAPSRPSSPEPSRPVQTASIDDGFINRAKQNVASRDLVYEKVNDAPTNDAAVYVVNVSTDSRRVQTEITLKHR